MCTTTLKFKIFRADTTQCTTHIISWNSTWINISIKSTRLRSRIILPFNTFLCIWSQIRPIFRYISCCMTYSISWNICLNVRFCIVLISWEWSITNLKNMVFIFITCSWSSITVISPSSKNLWSITGSIVKLWCISWISSYQCIEFVWWTRSHIQSFNFVTRWLIYQTCMYNRCFSRPYSRTINRECHIVSAVTICNTTLRCRSLPILKVPNWVCKAFSTWI